MTTANKRLRVYYSGRVQGVGFRFTVQRIAADLGVVGWIKNLPDARVELVCEGREKELQKFLAKIDKEFAGYIHQKNVDCIQVNGELTNFEIKFF